MLSFLEKVKFGRNDYAVTYKGITTAGQKFFAFILCNAKSYLVMKEDYENSASVPDIRKYGEVLYMDYRLQPNETDIKFLEKLLEKRKPVTA